MVEFLCRVYGMWLILCAILLIVSVFWDRAFSKPILFGTFVLAWFLTIIMNGKYED